MKKKDYYKKLMDSWRLDEKVRDEDDLPFWYDGEML